MNKPSLALTAGVAMALAGLAPTVASATGVCYAFVPNNYIEASQDGDPPLVLRYITTGVGSINTDSEARTLGHLKQTAYSLVGKSTALFDDRCATTSPADCGTEPATDYPQIRLMTTIDGTIITGKVLSGTKPADAPGAHMGINMHFLRTIPGIDEFAIGPIDLECTSPYSSPYPLYWICHIRAELGLGYFPLFQQYSLNLPVRLEKLPANTARACSVFQDGRLEVPAPL